MKIIKPKFWDKKNISLPSIFLFPLAFFYQFILKFKNYLTLQRNFNVPIICIGNIYIGGTGKTPLAIKVFEFLKELKKQPVVIKKKYSNQLDEELLLKKYCNVIISSNRADGIKEAIEKNYNVIILDDGYQDLSIKKNLNIVCFHSSQKIGNGQTIPSGPLRESLKSLRNCDLIFYNGQKDITFEEKLNKYNSKLKYIYFNYNSNNINNYKNKNLIAFAGIGNPDNFFNFLKKNNLNLVKEIYYPDHFKYSRKDLENLINLKEKMGALLVTTEKDYLRIETNYVKYFNFISIQTKFESPELFRKVISSNIL